MLWTTIIVGLHLVGVALHGSVMRLKPFSCRVGLSHDIPRVGLMCSFRHRWSGLLAHVIRSLAPRCHR